MKRPSTPYRWNRERHVSIVAWPVVRDDETAQTLHRVHDAAHVRVLTAPGSDLVTITYAGKPVFVVTATAAKELGMVLIAEGDRVAL